MIEGVERACSPRCPSTVSAAPCSPVLVVRAGEHEYVLIDGYARVESLVALGRDVVEATVLDLTEPEALVFVHRLEATRPRSALEEGWLIAELVDRHGWSHRTIALRLQRSASWICRRLALVRTLPESVQCAVLAGTVSPQAAMKSLVPLARANNSDCECLVANLRETLSVRQAERLYQGWKRADLDGREHIVTMPWLFLQAFEATQVAAAPDGDPMAVLFSACANPGSSPSGDLGGGLNAEGGVPADALDASTGRDVDDALDAPGLDVREEMLGLDGGPTRDLTDLGSGIDASPPAAPRPIAPLSTSTVTSQRPTLRWELPSGDDGAELTLCRDRALTNGCRTEVAVGDRLRVARALAPGWWFWGLRSRRTEMTIGPRSAVWQVWVGARSADGDRDTSWGTVAGTCQR